MPKAIALLGPNGQVGRAIQEALPNVTPIGREIVDLSNPLSLRGVDFSGFDTIVNCAAYTKVDLAEEEPDSARAINATVPGVLADIAERTGAVLVHFSTDYVFDGTKEVHTETERPNPLSVYGSTKHIGDVMALGHERTYDLRTSWVIGDGSNFVRTMLRLARDKKQPPVVNDQFGRPSFTTGIAHAVSHLLHERPEFGLYNVSSAGERTTWFEIASRVFDLAGAPAGSVTPTDTVTHFGDRAHATRPVHSTFDLSKISATGFGLNDWEIDLVEYVEHELRQGA
jgi:dTDP-4-dehydrorhamnose 3,5-epimerase/reductase